jgi:hypothetical protein
MVGIHLTFVVTGLIFALSEKYMHQQSHWYCLLQQQNPRQQWRGFFDLG